MPHPRVPQRQISCAKGETCWERELAIFAYLACLWRYSVQGKLLYLTKGAKRNGKSYWRRGNSD